MKKVFKKSNIFSFLLGAIIFGGIVCASAYTILANDIGYTPSDASWKKSNGDDISTVKDAIDELYMKSNDNSFMPLIPRMTSNISPSGEAKASREVSGYEAYKAFDGNIKPDTDYWSDNSVSVWSNSTWLQYKFVSPVCARALVYRSFWGGYWYVKDFQILASNDETNWTVLYEGTHDISDSGLEYIDLNNNEKYLYYRMNMLNSNVGNMTVMYFQLLG